MQKHEFESRINAEVSESEYRIIEYVYNYLPAMNKDNIAMLYQMQNGMEIIRNLLPAAKEAEAIETKMLMVRNQINDLQKELNKLNSQLLSIGH